MRTLAIASLALVAALATGCKCSGDRQRDRTADARPAPARPDLDLVVLVVIDQWPSWSFEKDLPVLKGGLARLVAEGVFFPRAEYPYASTFTAPGHAALGTGAPPAVTGILANGWFRRGPGKYQAATDDPAQPVFDINAIAAGKPGALVAGYGASPAALLVDGVADQLRRDKPRARAISVGMKQRAAVLQIGRRPHLAIWYDDGRVAMTTGTFWTDEPPRWLIDLAREHPVSARLEAKWDVSDPEFLAAHTGGSDDQDGEASAMGFDRAFPHDLTATPDRNKAMRATPSGTALTFETARAALAGEKLGKRGATDLLAITISSHDYAGHFWGQSSWERFDTLRQIDLQLGEFLDHLDAVIGADRYAVVVTSDHGAVPLVERSVAKKRDARRVAYEELIAAADAGITSVLGKGKWVIGYSANSLYLTDEALASPRAAEAIAAAVARLRAIPNLALVASRDSLAGGDCGRHPTAIEQQVCRSAHVDRSGEILLVPARYSLFVEARFPTGSAHGTPSVEDRMVPLIIRRPGVKPRRGSGVTTLQVAPTLAALLGISPPPAATEPAIELGPGGSKRQ